MNMPKHHVEETKARIVMLIKSGLLSSSEIARALQMDDKTFWRYKRRIEQDEADKKREESAIWDTL